MSGDLLRGERGEVEMTVETLAVISGQTRNPLQYIIQKSFESMILRASHLLRARYAALHNPVNWVHCGNENGRRRFIGS